MSPEERYGDVVKTFRGVEVPIDKMSHQHMSNWYWYSYLIMEDYPLSDYWIDKIQERGFENMLLYRPHNEFTYEMKVLKDKGYLNEYGKIFFEGKQIGVVE